jgi:hypothetical protein
MSEIDNNQPQGVTPSQDSTSDNSQQPSLFQSVMANQIATPQPNQQPPMGQQAPPSVTSSPGHPVTSGTGDPLDSHPAVQHASVLHKVAETLAGGPRTITSFDPQTGERIEKKQPLTNKQILVGALANILGTIGNAAEGFSAGMQHRAPRPAQPLPTMAADQQQAQQSEEDFNRQQNLRVRQATIMHSNLEAMRLSYAMRHEADSSFDQVISNHKDDLENWNKAGAVEASQVPSSELLQKGFDKSKYVAIPDGYVPVYDKNTGKRTVSSDGVPVSELTYSVVDGTTQAPLTQDKYQQLVNYGLMRPQKPLSDQGNTFKLPEGATISSAQLALMNHKLGLIQQTQRELDEVHDAVGGEKVDLAAKIKQNPKILSALEAFHNDGTSDDPAKQLVNLRASNNPKAQSAVGTMISLFGQDNLDKWIARSQTAPDKMDANSAQQIIADPRTDKNSPAYKTAVSFLAGQRGQKRDEKQDEVNAQRAIENGDLGTAAQNIVAGNVAQIKDLASFRGDQKARLYNMITDAATKAGKDPKDYSPAKLEAKAKVLNDFADGKAADNIMAFNTFLQHGAEALDATAGMRAQAGSPLINKSLNWLRKNAANDTNFSAFQAALVPVRKEYMNFLNNNRAEHEADLKVMDKVLSDDATPAQIEASLKQLGESADARLRELGRKYSNTMGEEYPNLIAPEGQAALKKMGVQSSLTSSPQAGRASAPNQGSAPAPEGTIVNTASGQQIKRGGKWVAYTGQ